MNEMTATFTAEEKAEFRLQHAAALRAAKGTRSEFAAMFLPQMSIADLDEMRERQAAELEASVA